MAHHFVEVHFENTSVASTELVVSSLLMTSKYTHITGYTGCLTGMMPATMTEQEVKDFFETRIHPINEGCFVGVEFLTEKEVEHLL